MKLALLAAALLTILPVAALAKRPVKRARPNQPIKITARTFELLPDSQRGIWKGDVQIVRNDLKIWCDTLTAEYDSKNQFKTLICQGHAHLLQKAPAPGKPDREAWGDKAVFDNKTSILVVTGSPRAREGDTTLDGSKVTFYVDQNRLVVDNPVVVGKTTQGLPGTGTDGGSRP